MASVLEVKIHLREAGNRAIGAAFLASVALHLLLLAAWPTLRDPAKRAELSPGPLIARLIVPKASEPLATAASRADERGTPEPETAPTTKPEPSPKAVSEGARDVRPMRKAPSESSPLSIEEPESPQPAQTESPVRRATPKEVAILAPRAVPPAPEPEVAATTIVPADTAQAPADDAPRAALAPSVRGAITQRPAAASAPQAPDPGTLAQYRLAVIDAAKRYKRYPRAALDNNWEGRVEVRMVIGAGGAIASLDVRASAGHEVLDREALDMIRQAKPQTPIPTSLRGREFAIEIPVIFSLRDPGA